MQLEFSREQVSCATTGGVYETSGYATLSPEEIKTVIQSPNRDAANSVLGYIASGCETDLEQQMRWFNVTPDSVVVQNGDVVLTHGPVLAALRAKSRLADKGEAK